MTIGPLGFLDGTNIVLARAVQRAKTVPCEYFVLLSDECGSKSHDRLGRNHMGLGERTASHWYIPDFENFVITPTRVSHR